MDKKGALQLVAAGGGVWLLWLTTVGLGVLMLCRLAETVNGHRQATLRRRVLRRMISGVELVLSGILAYSTAKIASGGSPAGS